MHRHRNEPPPARPPHPETDEFRVQRLVLLELVVTPPATGDRVEYLVRVLDAEASAIDRAIAGLEAAGLVRRDGDVVRATDAALYVEHLSPLRV